MGGYWTSSPTQHSSWPAGPPTRAWPLPIATSPTTTLPSWAGHLFRGQQPACLGSSYVTSGRILTLSMPWYPRIRWGVTVPAPQGLGASRVPGLGPGVSPLRRLACSELSTQQVLCGQPLGREVGVASSLLPTGHSGAGSDQGPGEAHSGLSSELNSPGAV